LGGEVLKTMECAAAQLKKMFIQERGGGGESRGGGGGGPVRGELNFSFSRGSSKKGAPCQYTRKRRFYSEESDCGPKKGEV